MSTKQATEAAHLKNEQLYSDKKKFEFVWGAIFATVMVGSAMIGKKIYNFQTLSEFDEVRCGTFWELLFYGGGFCILFTLFDRWVHYMLDDWCMEHYITENNYYDKEKRAKRCYTLVKWLYSIPYYGITSVVAYLLIKDTNYFPAWLGGHGAVENLMVGLPALPEATFGMKVFYICQFGKHLSRTVSHLIRPEGAFYEYILHHSLSVFLIFFSYLTNMWLIGILVMLVHDLSDFFLISGRAYKISAGLAFSFWVICRLIIFSSCCVYAGFYGSMYVARNSMTESQAETVIPSVYTMSFMMLALEIMHIFWTYWIVKSFISVSVSSKMAKHDYD